jgi:hypothetical protein
VFTLRIQQLLSLRSSGAEVPPGRALGGPLRPAKSVRSCFRQREGELLNSKAGKMVTPRLHGNWKRADSIGATSGEPKGWSERIPPFGQLDLFSHPSYNFSRCKKYHLWNKLKLVFREGRRLDSLRLRKSTRLRQGGPSADRQPACLDQEQRFNTTCSIWFCRPVLSLESLAEFLNAG